MIPPWQFDPTEYHVIPRGAKSPGHAGYQGLISPLVWTIPQVSRLGVLIIQCDTSQLAQLLYNILYLVSGIGMRTYLVGMRARNWEVSHCMRVSLLCGIDFADLCALSWFVCVCVCFFLVTLVVDVGRPFLRRTPRDFYT